MCIRDRRTPCQEVCQTTNIRRRREHVEWRTSGRGEYESPSAGGGLALRASRLPAPGGSYYPLPGVRYSTNFGRLQKL
eukprot:1398434-Alexandrium_andersonii.AAC.1